MHCFLTRSFLLLLLLVASSANSITITECSNNPEKNLALLNKAANNHDVVNLEFKECEISNTWIVPSGIKISGIDSRLGTRIIQKSQNAPVIANRAWYSGKPIGSTRIQNIWLSGSNNSKSKNDKNHCLVLLDYYSTVENVYATNCGGYGIYFSRQMHNGHFYQKTLVENNILNSTIRCAKKGFRNGTPSDKYKPVLTDGYMSNIRIDMECSPNGSAFELYDAAGWIVEGLHTYAHNKPVLIYKPGHTNISNWYIENEGLEIKSLSHSINITNFSLATPLTGNKSPITVSGVDWVKSANVNVANLSFIRNKDHKGELIKSLSKNVTINR